MSDSVAWEFIKTLGSIAGGLTFFWRVVDAIDAHRSRLSIRTTAAVEGRLDIDITYRARSEHAALIVEVTALFPKDGNVAIQRPLPTGNWSAEQAVDVMVTRGDVSRSAKRALTLVREGQSAFQATAEVFLEPTQEQRAKIKFTIRDGATRRQVMSKTLWVMPTG